MRRADDLIQRFLDTIGQSEGSVYVSLFRSWEPIVGERIGAHSQPVDVRGRTLSVEADHPGWVQKVMMRRTRIIAELKRRFPELGITGIAVRVVDRPGSTPAATGRSPSQPDERATHASPDNSDSDERAASAPPPPPPSRDEKEALERIEDEDLRDALARLRDDLDE